ncbi:FIG00958806: hypothetical protein, partial [Pseudomonas fluorescens]
DYPDPGGNAGPEYRQTDPAGNRTAAGARAGTARHHTTAERRTAEHDAPGYRL